MTAPVRERPSAARPSASPGPGSIRARRSSARRDTRPTCPVPGLLHARLVLSLYAHARIDSIDKRPALAGPGRRRGPHRGRPADQRLRATCACSSRSPAARRCSPDQPIAIVVAESEAAAAGRRDGGRGRLHAARRRDRPRGGHGRRCAARAAASSTSPARTARWPRRTPRSATATTTDGRGEVEIGNIGEASASPHAAVGGGEQAQAHRGALAERDRPPLAQARRRRRGARRAPT